MITLDKIISSNLEMLKQQEAELLKSLSFVQKARELFEGQNGSTPKSSTPKSSTPKRRFRTSSKPAAKKTQVTPAVTVSSQDGNSKDTRISRVIAVLKQKNAPMKSAELVDTLFKRQKEDKNLGHFRQLIYTTLTKAYRKGTVKRKNGMISLPK